ncbi:MAG: hypothetical protein U0401_29385 [Anaerolineae bacterium]
MRTFDSNTPLFKQQPKQHVKSILALISLAGLATGCNTALAQGNQNEVKTIPGAAAVLPTLMPTPTPLASNPVVLPAAAATPWTAAPSWPTPTPWPTPAAWRPALPALPTLAPMPVAPAAVMRSVRRQSHSVWTAMGLMYLAERCCAGPMAALWLQMNSLTSVSNPTAATIPVFVEWTKTPEYQLNPWSGWQPGLYTWQIGIIKGTLEGENKHFIGDTGRASQPLLIKWQAGGGGGGNGGPGGGGGGVANQAAHKK